ncbi:MAG: hypothetical protein AAGE59_12745 [Cyanobacteria bacterium P01_F01_bin.86]
MMTDKVLLYLGLAFMGLGLICIGSAVFINRDQLLHHTLDTSTTQSLLAMPQRLGDF